MKLQHWILLFLSFLVIAAVIYSPSLGGPWQYDDYAQILDEKVLTGRSIPQLLGSVFRFSAWPDGWTGTRDLVRASFSLNWSWWGDKPAGYRWMNLIIHVVNSVLVSLLVALLFNKLRPKAEGLRTKEIQERQSSALILHPSSFILGV